MPKDDHAGRKAFGPGRPHVIVLEHLEHRRAGEAGEEPDAELSEDRGWQQESRFRAAITPRGMPIAHARTIEVRASSAVAGTKTANSCKTGAPESCDVPMSPWARCDR